MRGIALFVSGLLVGATLIGSHAQEGRFSRLNHVGIVVANYAEAVDFYTKTLGFREAYTIRNADGSPRLTYLQLSRETFVELIPAAPGQATGITHFGVEVGDLAATVAQVRGRGTTIDDPSLTPANALFSRTTDTGGVQIEVMQFGPEALQRKAMDAWK